MLYLIMKRQRYYSTPVWLPKHVAFKGNFFLICKGTISSLLIYFGSGLKARATLLMQYRLWEGSGPSSNTWPKWESHCKRTKIVKHITCTYDKHMNRVGNSLFHTVQWPYIVSSEVLNMLLQGSHFFENAFAQI